MSNSAEYFKNRKKAHNWLKDEGYKVSQGKFYQDISNNGFPAINADKSVSKYQVMVYAKQLDGATTTDLAAIERSEYLHRKEKADAEIAEMKAEKMRREEDALWVPADAAWAAMAATIGNLRYTIRRTIGDKQIKIVEKALTDVNVEQRQTIIELQRELEHKKNQVAEMVTVATTPTASLADQVENACNISGDDTERINLCLAIMRVALATAADILEKER